MTLTGMNGTTDLKYISKTMMMMEWLQVGNTTLISIHMTELIVCLIPMVMDT
jgi:hypothetical protein